MLTLWCALDARVCLHDGGCRDEVLAVANKLQLVDIQELHNRVWKVADAIKNMDPTGKGSGVLVFDQLIHRSSDGLV